MLTSDRITETDILDGRWDNAEVEVWRVNWADTGQRVLMRRGAIGQIRRGRLAFVAEVRSLAHVLGQTVGRTFQATCDAALGDARCGVDLEDPAFKGTGAVIDLLRDRAFTASGLGGFDAGWFTFGTLDWTSGANAGRRTEVLGHDVTDGVAILTLLEAPVRAIAEGDAFTIRAGCDKRIETCGAKFANTANFRGFPHIPGQDAVLRYATKDGGHEGACCEPPPIPTRVIAIARSGSARRITTRRACAVSAAIASGSPGASGARSSAPSRSRSRPTAATGARPDRARCWPRARAG